MYHICNTSWCITAVSRQNAEIHDYLINPLLSPDIYSTMPGFKTQKPSPILAKLGLLLIY